MYLSISAGVSAQTSPVFEATDFGTFSAEKVDHAPTIRRTIKAAVAAGGGTVKLPAGSYWVAVDNTGAAINVPAGVTLDMRGTTLQLIENALPSYQVLLFSGTGAPSGVIGGTIVGDRDRHQGTAGEWGMCISVRGAVGVTIKGTKAFSCWGDGIYVGASTDGRKSPARRVEIEDVEAAHNLRNNISLVALQGFRVANSHLHNARGKAPQAGIDLEPNDDDIIEDGEIVNVLTEKNLSYGFVIGGQAGAVRKVRIDRVRSLDNGGMGFLFQSTSALSVGSIEARRNKGHGLAIIRASDIAAADYEGHDNTGSVLLVADSKNVDVRKMTHSGTAKNVPPVDLDRRSTVKVGP